MSVGNRCIALSSTRSTFCVVIEPTIRVVNKWPNPNLLTSSPAKDTNPSDAPSVATMAAAPPATATTTTTAATTPTVAIAAMTVKPAGAMPCLCWSHINVEGKRTEMLCRGWGDKLQFLKMHYPDEEAVYPSFGCSGAFNVRGDIKCLCPLGNRHVGILVEAEGVFAIDVINTVGIFLVSSVDLLSSPSQLVHCQYSNGANWHGDSLRSCGGEAYILMETELNVLKVSSWNTRIDKLVEAGEWLR